jgi:hypothetical protein
VEEDRTTSDESTTDDAPENISFGSDRAKELLERMRQETERDAKRRQDGRPKGQLSRSLLEKLKACNVQQLLQVKNYSDQFISAHKLPPSRHECRLRHVVRVLAAVPVRNKLFQVELRRNSARAARVYVNGPYVCAYWRDGQYIRKKNYSKDEFKRLPRKVAAALKPFLHSNEVEQLRLKLQQRLIDYSGE